jgi:hypothetical protein
MRVSKNITGLKNVKGITRMIKPYQINVKSEYVLQDIITHKYKAKSGYTNEIEKAQVFTGRTLQDFKSWKYLNWQPLEFINSIV